MDPKVSVLMGIYHRRSLPYRIRLIQTGSLFFAMTVLRMVPMKLHNVLLPQITG